jgi:hypothetical protein
MRTRIRGGWVVGHERGAHTLDRNHEVVFEGDAILYVGLLPGRRHLTYQETPMKPRHVLLAAALALVAAAAVAQTDYPSKPVRIIVPFGPGGAADTLPRLLAQNLSPMWGQPVVVENRTGAAGNIGMEQGAKAAADGYTLTSAPVGNLAINPHLYSKLSFDVLKDLTPIVLVASVQNVLVVNPAVPANNLKELIAYAKMRPGGLTYGSGGVGTQAHVGGEIFEASLLTILLAGLALGFAGCDRNPEPASADPPRRALLR